MTALATGASAGGGPLTISEAKKGLSFTFGVTLKTVEITIRG
jgi:hypothetical protein